MTDKEYKVTIDDLVASGRAYSAISDLSKLMELYTYNVKSAMKEMNAEKKAIIKIITNKSVTVKDKLKAVESLYT